MEFLTCSIMDLATRTWYSFPVTSKDALDTFIALDQMKGRAKIKHVYSENVSSIRETVKLSGINWETCQPGAHHNNDIIERFNQELGLKIVELQNVLGASRSVYLLPVIVGRVSSARSINVPSLFLHLLLLRRRFGDCWNINNGICDRIRKGCIICRSGRATYGFLCTWLIHT